MLGWDTFDMLDSSRRMYFLVVFDLMLFTATVNYHKRNRVEGNGCGLEKIASSCILCAPPVSFSFG